MREEYEKWFNEKFKHPPMPLDSRVLDFCWHGYQAGAASRDAEGSQLSEQVKLLRDALEQHLDDMGEDGHCVCEAAKQQAIEALAATKESNEA